MRTAACSTHGKRSRLFQERPGEGPLKLSSPGAVGPCMKNPPESVRVLGLDRHNPWLSQVEMTARLVFDSKPQACPSCLFHVESLSFAFQPGTPTMPGRGLRLWRPRTTSSCNLGKRSRPETRS